MFDDNENLNETTNSSASDSYETALTELKAVLKAVDSQGTSLDDVLVNIQQANKLVQHCKDKLRAIEKNVNEIL